MTWIGAVPQVVRLTKAALSVECPIAGGSAISSHSWTSEDSKTMSWFAALRDLRDRIAYRVLCQIDRLRRSKPFRLLTVRRATFPKVPSIADRSLYITELRHLQKWASFYCPGGCGKIVRLQLTGTASPRWTARTDWLGRATLTPSVRQLTDCGCHFWVRKGCIDWCADTPLRIWSGDHPASAPLRPHRTSSEV